MKDISIKSYAYLIEHCKKERSISVFQTADSSKGLFIDAYESKIDVGLLGKVSNEVDRLQYIEPIYWVDQLSFYSSNSILRVSPFEFTVTNSYPATKYPFMIWARKNWWDTTGRELGVYLETSWFAKKMMHSRASDIVGANVHVRQPLAKYELKVRDISTFEDRKNWVARGQIRLVERESQKIIAEYIGFASNRDTLAPFVYSSPWENVNVCQGIEEKYLSKDKTNRFDVREFFFKEVVKYSN